MLCCCKIEGRPYKTLSTDNDYWRPGHAQIAGDGPFILVASKIPQVQENVEYIESKDAVS